MAHTYIEVVSDRIGMDEQEIRTRKKSEVQ